MRDDQRQQMWLSTTDPAMRAEFYRQFNVKNRQFNVKEKIMSDSVDMKVAQAIQAKKDQEELTRKLALVEAYGDDVYEDGTMVRFTKEFANSDLEYVYVAVKCIDKWYLTGTINKQGHSWEEFVMFLVSGISVEPVDVEEVTPTDHSLNYRHRAELERQNEKNNTKELPARKTASRGRTTK